MLLLKRFSPAAFDVIDTFMDHDADRQKVLFFHCFHCYHRYQYHQTLYQPDPCSGAHQILPCRFGRQVLLEIPLCWPNLQSRIWCNIFFYKSLKYQVHLANTQRFSPLWASFSSLWSPFSPSRPLWPPWPPWPHSIQKHYFSAPLFDIYPWLCLLTSLPKSATCFLAKIWSARGGGVY